MKNMTRNFIKLIIVSLALIAFFLFLGWLSDKLEYQNWNPSNPYQSHNI